jgi:hypothetical protein
MLPVPSSSSLDYRIVTEDAASKKQVTGYESVLAGPPSEAAKRDCELHYLLPGRETDLGPHIPSR